MKEREAFLLRLSGEVLKVIRKEAKREKRSVSAQIIYAVEYYLEGLGLLPKEKDGK